jgi:hypothetical protein
MISSLDYDNTQINFPARPGHWCGKLLTTVNNQETLACPRCYHLLVCAGVPMKKSLLKILVLTQNKQPFFS